MENFEQVINLIAQVEYIEVVLRDFKQESRKFVININNHNKIKKMILEQLEIDLQAEIESKKGKLDLLRNHI
jgi:hypothetical protein